MGMYSNTMDDQQLGRDYSNKMGAYQRGQNTFNKYKKIGSPIMQGVGAALAPFTFGLSSLILGVADTATQAGLAAKNKKLLSKVNDVGFWKSNHVNQVDNSAVDPSGAINGVKTFMSTNTKSNEEKVDAAVKSNQGITQDVNAAPQTYDPATSNPSQNFGSSVGSRTQSQGTWPAPTGPAASFGNGANTSLYGYAEGGGIFSRGSFAKPIARALKSYSNSLAKGGYAKGGPAGTVAETGTGTKTDDVPKVLEEGQFVIPAEQMARFKTLHGKFFPELFKEI